MLNKKKSNLYLHLIPYPNSHHCDNEYVMESIKYHHLNRLTLISIMHQRQWICDGAYQAPLLK